MMSKKSSLMLALAVVLIVLFVLARTLR